MYIVPVFTCIIIANEQCCSSLECAQTLNFSSRGDIVELDTCISYIQKKNKRNVDIFFNNLPKNKIDTRDNWANKIKRHKPTLIWGAWPNRNFGWATSKSHPPPINVLFELGQSRIKI